MTLEEKIMHFANFNITFGKKEEPMLSHFLDIIYPAFTSDYRRGGPEAKTHFYMTGVEVKEVGDEYILAGNFIKDTQYDIYTNFQNGQLVEARSSVPTAPYSRFIIFLKNHRMILVRNESQSPDIRSFQAMVRNMINYYRTEENQKRNNKEKLPYALVNIVDIPLPKDIKAILKDVKKIKSLNLRFFPLNNDICPTPLFLSMRNEMKSVVSNRAQVKFSSPGSPEGVGHLITQSAGLAAVSLEAVDKNDHTTRIRQDKFSTSMKIAYGGDIKPEDDEYFIAQAKQESVISATSQENDNLYRKVLDIFKNLLK